MPSPRAAWTKLILELLTDNDSVGWEEMIARVGPVIPPGFAWRAHVREREGAADRLGRPRPARPKPGDAAAIASGRRGIITNVLGTLRKGGTVEYDSELPKSLRRIRILACECCGRPF